MKNNNYITVQGWMVNELHLSGNELLLYALIFGFSQDGESEYYGSQSYMAESLGLTRESVLRTIKRLEDKGLIKKSANGDLFKSKLKYQAIIKCDETSHEDVTKHHNISDETSHNNIVDTIDDNKEEDKSSKKVEIDEFIEKIYNMYPSKCPKRNASLNKGSKDKIRIKKLLKQYSMEDIEKVVRYEVETKYQKDFMSNFSTFLNNFPDPSCIEGLESEDKVSSDDNNNNNSKWQY